MSAPRPTVHLPAAVLILLLAVAGGAASDPPDDDAVLRQAGVPNDGPGLLNFFRSHTPRDEDVRALVQKLGDPEFQVREAVSAALARLGKAAEPHLREATRSPDAEVARRAEIALKALEEGPSTAVVAAAARTLAARRPPGAAEALLGFLPFAHDEPTLTALRDALARLALRDGKPEPALLAALDSPAALIRASACVVLARAAPDALPAVRKRLADTDPHVRLAAALALAHLRERDAVPVLIDALAALPADDAGPAEDFLYRLADDSAPEVPAGRDPAARRRARDAWARWWKDEGPRVDLARTGAAAPLRGYTMMVLLDAGRIREIDAAGKVRWEIDGLDFPLDAQLLPGERVLVAEYQGNRVTERNRKGEVLWQRIIDGPLMAQRLPGGNTLIATRLQVVEVDPAGKQVFSYFRPGNDLVQKAQKGRAGDIGMVTSLGRFALVNPQGKEVAGFPVNVTTSGGRVELLPGGRVLLPLKDANKVVEYDSRGKVVWEAAFPSPVAAVRLANGHTLITAFQSTKAVEVDAAGKTVWEHDAGTRLTRAWRR